ncbi:hypothetical protein Q3G72_002571 [Acer saccharum]|nr:hypothetical protein Q3G72_002571 [Acer saccharum]
MHGKFSVKSDVFSFGVLVLESVTGKKNSNFYQTDGAEDLLSYVWKHWRDGTPTEVLDSNLTDSYSRNEVMRCIQLLSSFLPSLLNQEDKKFQTAICVCSDETSMSRKYVFALYFRMVFVVKESNERFLCNCIINFKNFHHVAMNEYFHEAKSHSSESKTHLKKFYRNMLCHDMKI